MNKNGLILINKKIGVTSRSVDNFIMKKFSTKKVGHLGTLDPFAEGLLVIGLNEGTKVLPYVIDEPKIYEATFLFGKETRTLDNTSEIINEAPVPKLTKNEITQVLQGFVGKITQIPPLTSAIKVDGVPLYKYAHKGIEKEVPEREVMIYAIELLHYEEPELTLRISCGSGTYIRTLGNDIAKKLGTVATTIKLKRTNIGSFSLKNANDLEDEQFNIIAPCSALSHIKSIEVSKDDAKKIKNGIAVSIPSKENLLLAIYDNKLLAILERKAENYVVKRGFNL